MEMNQIKPSILARAPIFVHHKKAKEIGEVTLTEEVIASYKKKIKGVNWVVPEEMLD